MAIERLAQLYSSRLQYTQALLTLSQAIATYDTALYLADDDFCNHELKANALESIADLKLNLSQYTEAIENYQMAIVHHETSLRLKPMKANTFALGQTLSPIRQLSRAIVTKVRSAEELSCSTIVI
jgi:tetratricopeptide (TPR) repeat protein